MRQSAQSYPGKPVRMVIAFPAGGSIDTLGRILAQKLSEQWGQSVVVENRPGAGGNLGAAAAAQAAPDGYTLHLGAQTLAVNPTIAPYQGFDPIRDFEPIRLVATAQDVLMVAPGFAVSFREGSDRRRQEAIQANSTTRPSASAPARILRPCCSRRWRASSCSTCHIRPALRRR